MEPSSTDRELELLVSGARVFLVVLVVVVALGVAVWTVRAPQSPGVGQCTPTATGEVCSVADPGP